MMMMDTWVRRKSSLTCAAWCMGSVTSARQGEYFAKEILFYKYVKSWQYYYPWCTIFSPAARAPTLCATVTGGMISTSAPAVGKSAAMSR